MGSGICRYIWKWEIINPDDPDQDNGTNLVNYCIVINPWQCSLLVDDTLVKLEDDDLISMSRITMHYGLEENRIAGSHLS
ncbi:hypothetical protein TNCV_512351 [Trichonephila clavipes]|nr:hypothetical protein TNCV_512351 [Trichonephila clavipes]